MGEVYQAIDTKIGDVVAIKLIREDLLRDGEWEERFRREASIAEALDSPYIAKLLAAGVSKGAKRPWLAFELLRGESLDALLDRDPRLAFGDVAWMVRDLLLGLAAAHEGGIVHRDIKPGNLFIDRQSERLRVLDFGVAKVARGGAPTSGLTRVAETLGTPAFMSPEQLRNSKSVDARADLYSAGCVGFLLLTGRLPFEGADPVALLSQKQSASPSLSRVSGVTWPGSVQGWVARTIAARADDRFADARAAEVAWREAVRTMTTHVQAPSSSESLREDTEVLPPSGPWRADS